jgi:hypothetical protein
VLIALYRILFIFPLKLLRKSVCSSRNMSITCNLRTYFRRRLRRGGEGIVEGAKNLTRRRGKRRDYQKIKLGRYSTYRYVVGSNQRHHNPNCHDTIKLDVCLGRQILKSQHIKAPTPLCTRLFPTPYHNDTLRVWKKVWPCTSVTRLSSFRRIDNWYMCSREEWTETYERPWRYISAICSAFIF